MQLINTAARDATVVVKRLRELYRERREIADDAAVDLARCVEEVVALTQPRWKNQARGQGIMIGVENRCRRRCRSSSATPPRSARC